MPRHPNTLPRWQRLLLHGVGVALLASGGAWLALHYRQGVAVDVLPHPLEPWLMRLQGLAAFAALFVMGLLCAVHLPQGWRLSARPRHAGQRGTGLAMALLLLLLALTGWQLYYLAPESIRPGLGWLHSALGAIVGALLVMHRRRHVASRIGERARH